MQTQVFIPCTFKRKRFQPINTQEELANAINDPNRDFYDGHHDGRQHHEPTDWVWETLRATVIAFVGVGTYDNAFGSVQAVKAVVMLETGQLRQMDPEDLIVIPAVSLDPVVA